jgi:hypothetical protein
MLELLLASTNSLFICNLCKNCQPHLPSINRYHYSLTVLLPCLEENLAGALPFSYPDLLLFSPFGQ